MLQVLSRASCLSSGANYAILDQLDTFPKRSIVLLQRPERSFLTSILADNASQPLLRCNASSGYLYCPTAMCMLLLLCTVPQLCACCSCFVLSHSYVHAAPALYCPTAMCMLLLLCTVPQLCACCSCVPGAYLQKWNHFVNHFVMLWWLLPISILHFCDPGN